MRYIIFFLFSLISLPIFAFQVQPMVSEIQPTGSQSQKTIRVFNNSDKPLTVEVFALDLLFSENGKEELRPNDDDFLIIPLTTIIPAGKTQSVIIRYIGEPILSESKSYRIAINQVTVDLGELDGSGIGMALSFKTLLNVVPNNAKANLLIKNKEQVGKDTWKVSLENTGNKFIRLSQAKWVVKNKDQIYILEGQKLSNVLDGKFLLPNSSREVFIKIPSAFDAKKSNLEVVL
ncbi:molecular chaperone [Marinomonas rhizomae]|uniref:P pilus assembly chaperone PapD n=1 Tax=Marinomonas rhizomae TaxID=491948 RepID=A0A366J899_9GAMM|nr:molecular chaperone [Marinomonas rhizomae]RBP82579.1 P pilus assembly chaperone PapD [Marinomonas rhizomae]RNF73636.1 molecular chaperone [Marinomonas rhizomae]